MLKQAGCRDYDPQDQAVHNIFRSRSEIRSSTTGNRLKFIRGYLPIESEEWREYVRLG